MALDFQIPGNIKQQFLPFVLKPTNTLNLNTGSSVDLNSAAGAQCFSFRNRDSSKYKAGFARLGICPASLCNCDFGSYFDKDVSNMLLYGTPGKPEPVTIDSILNQIPGVQIREFLPDTKLDQLLNFFGEMMRSVSDMFKDVDIGAALKSVMPSFGKQQTPDPKAKAAEDDARKAWDSKFDEFKDGIAFIADWLTGNMPDGMSTLFVKKDGKQRQFGENSDNSSVYTNTFGALKGRFNTYIVKFPFVLYYRLQSCVTTNVYELPCRIDQAWQTQGSAGWLNSNSIGVKNEWFDKIPVLGTVMKSLLGNIRVNYMPWWDSEGGSKTPPQDVEIQFDLFNDTAESAMLNFIFVNTIVPNNMWLQFGMFQHSPCLYDVKLEGHTRYFACAGDFGVKYSGVLRRPTDAWIHELVSKYANSGVEKTFSKDGKLVSSHNANKDKGGQLDPAAFEAFIKENDIIRIPDVYQVSLKFKSLLPQNFNTYLFQYVVNNTITTKYMDGGLFQPSALNHLIDTFTKDFDEDFKQNFEKYRSIQLKKREEEFAKKAQEAKMKRYESEQADKRDFGKIEGGQMIFMR